MGNLIQTLFQLNVYFVIYYIVNSKRNKALIEITRPYETYLVYLK